MVHRLFDRIYSDFFVPNQILTKFLNNQTSFSSLIPFTYYNWPPFIWQNHNQTSDQIKIAGPLYALLKEFAVKANAG